MSVLDRFRLDGKVALVTGASSGLGVAFAKALAEAGADVAVAARRADRLEQTRAQIEELGRKAIAVSCDVADPEQCASAVKETVDGSAGWTCWSTTPASAPRCRPPARAPTSSARSSTST